MLAADSKTLLLLKPRGFCAGVVRAIDIVRIALEVIGTLGEAPLVTQVVGTADEVDRLSLPDPNRVAYITQTTLSLDETKDIIAALKQKFPNIKGPAAQDICYATENR